MNRNQVNPKKKKKVKRKKNRLILKVSAKKTWRSTALRRKARRRDRRLLKIPLKMRALVSMERLTDAK